MSRPPNSEAPHKPTLARPRDEARILIESQIAHGRALEQAEIFNSSAFERWVFSKNVWLEMTSRLLRLLFDDDSIRLEFQGISVIYGASVTMSWPPPTALSDQVSNAQCDLVQYVARLDVICKRLDEMPELRPEHMAPIEDFSAIRPGRRVFLVHGRDSGTLQTVARFLEKLGLHPIILMEQANRGRTTIQKFREHSDVAFAVVILTGDDRGALKGVPYDQQKLRARQNVILELGYFLAKLGDAHVCALNEPGVEIPSDYLGVLPIEFNSENSWKLQLAQELKAAGLPVDMNKL